MQDNQEVVQYLQTLIRTLGKNRVVMDEELQEVLKAIIAILAENKKGVEGIAGEARGEVQKALKLFATEHLNLSQNVKNEIGKTKAEIEQMTKAQNDRAFKRLQELISQVKLPKDGKDGKPGEPGRDGEDGSPDSPEEVRDKLEKLKGEERLDAKFIKNLPEFIKKKGKEMWVAGIRYLENLADVSILTTDKREDLLLQYDTTNNRWESGIALTVSATQPSNPKINDLWVDIS